MMAATPPPIDAAAIAKLKNGDAAAYEQLFRQRYDQLLAEAMSHAEGDGSLAARAVGSAFAQLYRQRAQLDDPGALIEGLKATVVEAATRLRSKHAVASQMGSIGGAHAKGGSTAAPSVDEAWSKVRSSLTAPTSHTSEADQQVASRLRHDVASHMASIGKRPSRLPAILGGTAFAIVVGGIAWWGLRGSEETRLSSALNNATETKTLTGQYTTVTLQDGSRVRVAPSSTVRIPRAFGTTVRGVSLTGSAAFTVAPGGERRFIVRIDDARVYAEGTEFAVRAYPEENGIAVRVTDGNVRIRVGETEQTVAPGSAVFVDINGMARTPTPVEVEEMFGRIDGTIVAENRTLREALEITERWYGLQLFVADTSLLTRLVTLRAPADSSRLAVQSLETSGNLRQTWEGSNMVLVDRPARRR